MAKSLSAVGLPLEISEEVQQAKGRVVALESTIISHGMPYPKNLEVAEQIESAVREQGAVPATIAVIDGKIQVGLSSADLQKLARSGPEVLKVSRRDLAYALSKKRTGGTTVSATMLCAEMAGISVFATGGIGGVHRGAEETFDISADLQELSKTKVAVVCAGAKSILDLGLTLEVLETLSVPVLGFETQVFPAFYSRESKFSLEYRFDFPEEIASFLKYHWAVPRSGGALIVNPIPKQHEIPFEKMEAWIQAGVSEAKSLGISGKKVTPFLLSTLVKKTEGKSLEANIALVLNNAKLAARLVSSMNA